MNTNKNQSIPMIMGILNVTPDSFSDGGEYNTLELAIERGVEMVNQGASIIDVGGESTRPGAKDVSAQEQIARVVPVIEGIRKRLSQNILISIDATDYSVAKAALHAGADWINDISAGEGSAGVLDSKEKMLTLAAKENATIVLMHRQGTSDRMQENPQYDDICTEVKAYLQGRAKAALDAGVSKANIILDPGIGFGKLLKHNTALLADLASLVSLGYPVLLGTSRKRFIGELLNKESPQQRVIGTCATTALGVQVGVHIFRVHDVVENKEAMDIAWAIKQGGGG